MGQLVNGVWDTQDAYMKPKDGAFVRSTTSFRNWVTPDGSAGPSGEGGFQAEANRYHLYVSYACPWAHRTLIFRAVKGLDDLIDISVVHPDMLSDGWTFESDFPGATGDRLFGQGYLRDVYTSAVPDVSTRVTVPVLWDKSQSTIVSNESAEIIRMFNTAFNALTGNTEDYYPAELRDEIDAANTRVYDTFNNGVYKSGFARSQKAYDDAVSGVFETLDWLEARLERQAFVAGDRVTEADWRLAPTLFRFDPVYHTHFKCNRAYLRDYPNLWAYTRALYQWPTKAGRIADTVNFEHIVRHYHFSHDSINPHRIVPINPVLDWESPHGRG
ncbi:MAG: glutathione S-transferase family protein [Pseudomonadota bacterium]